MVLGCGSSWHSEISADGIFSLTPFFPFRPSLDLRQTNRKADESPTIAATSDCWFPRLEYCSRSSFGLVYSGCCCCCCWFCWFCLVASLDLGRTPSGRTRSRSRHTSSRSWPATLARSSRSSSPSRAARCTSAEHRVAVHVEETRTL